MNKHLEFIRQVGKGTAKESLEEFLDPTIKDKPWFARYKKAKENQTRVNIELSR